MFIIHEIIIFREFSNLAFPRGTQKPEPSFLYKIRISFLP
jgi:hypothetical protein